MATLVLKSFNRVKVLTIIPTELAAMLVTPQVATEPVEIVGLMTLGESILVFYKLIPPAPVFAA